MSLPSRTRSITALLAAIAAAAVLPAPVAAAVPHVTITGTTITDYAFAPDEVTIAKGRSVRWAWDGVAPHNVTFTSLGKASETAATGSYGHKFKRRGTFRYHCSVHGFKGKVVVK